jgi:hypothetical protein
MQRNDQSLSSILKYTVCLEIGFDGNYEAINIVPSIYYLYSSLYGLINNRGDMNKFMDQ